MTLSVKEHQLLRQRTLLAEFGKLAAMGTDFNGLPKQLLPASPGLVWYTFCRTAPSLDKTPAVDPYPR